MLLLLVTDFLASVSSLSFDPHSRLVENSPLFRSSSPIETTSQGVVGILPNGAYMFYNLKNGDRRELLTLSKGSSFSKVSPDETRFFLSTEQGAGIYNFSDGRKLVDLPRPGSHGWAAWSADSSYLLTIRQPKLCDIWSSAGVSLRSWSCCRQRCVGVTWSPGKLFAIADADGVKAYNASGSVIASYHLSFDVFSTILLASTIPTLAWSPDNSSKLAVVHSEGVEVLQMNNPKSWLVTSANFSHADIYWTADGAAIVQCGEFACHVYAANSLKETLFLDGTQSQRGVGFLADSIFVTADPDGISLWDIRTPFVRGMHPSVSCFTPSCRMIGWLDADRVLFGGKGVFEVNVRTEQTKVYRLTRLTQWEAQEQCVINDKLYILDETGAVKVVADGQIIHQLNTDLRQAKISCAFGHATVFLQKNAIVLDNDQVHRKIMLPMDVDVVSVVSPDFIAYITVSNQLYLWSPQMIQPKFLRDNVTNILWNPDGSLLAVSHKNIGWTIFSSQGEVYQTGQEQLTTPWSWSPDGTWLMARSSQYRMKAVLINPVLKARTFAEFSAGDYSAWNPKKMEVVSWTQGDKEEQGVRPMIITGTSQWIELWTPTPEVQPIRPVVVGAQSEINVSVVGARALGPSPKAIIIWADQSDSKSIQLPATLIDGNTISIPLLFTSPGLYTLYILAATNLADSSWVGGKTLTLICPEPSFPSLNGTVATCTCPENKYALQAANGGISCHDCPHHARCDGTTRIGCDPNYWLPPGSVHPVLCPARSCPGVKPSEEPQCSPGHDGPTCARCVTIPLTGQFGSDCRKCSSFGAEFSWVLLQFMLWIFLNVLLVYYFAMDPAESKLNSAQILLTMASMAQMETQLFDLILNIPVSDLTLGFIGSSQGGGFIHSGALPCTLLHAGVPASWIHYSKLIIIPGVLILVLVVVKILECCRCAKKVNFKVLTAVLCLSLQPYFVIYLFQTLTTQKIDSLGCFLRHDANVSCEGSQYTVAAALTWVSIVVVLAGPALLTWKLSKGKSDLVFLVKSYKSAWWFFLVYFRKICLAALVVSTRNSFYVAVCLFVFSLLHILISPSTAHAVNLAETTALTTCAFIYSVVGALGLSSTELYDGGVFIIWGVGILGYLTLLAIFLYDFRENDGIALAKQTCRNLADCCLWLRDELVKGCLWVCKGCRWICTTLAKGCRWVCINLVKGCRWVCTTLAKGCQWVCTTLAKGCRWLCTTLAKGCRWVCINLVKGCLWICTTLAKGCRWVCITLAKGCQWICTTLAKGCQWICTTLVKGCRWLCNNLAKGCLWLYDNLCCCCCRSRPSPVPYATFSPRVSPLEANTSPTFPGSLPPHKPPATLRVSLPPVALHSSPISSFAFVTLSSSVSSPR